MFPPTIVPPKTGEGTITAGLTALMILMRGNGPQKSGKVRRYYVRSPPETDGQHGSAVPRVASRLIGSSQSAVSTSVARLERRLSVRLI